MAQNDLMMRLGLLLGERAMSPNQQTQTMVNPEGPPSNDLGNHVKVNLNNSVGSFDSGVMTVSEQRGSSTQELESIMESECESYCIKYHGGTHRACFQVTLRRSILTIVKKELNTGTGMYHGK